VRRTPGPVRAGLDRERDTLNTGSYVESLYASRDRLLAVSYSSCAMLFASGAADPQPAHVELQRKCWVAHLNVRASVPFTASSSTCAMPFTVHDPAEAVLTAVPSAHLGMAGSDHSRPAACALCQPGPGGSWGAPNPLFVLGWLDGVVRCHKLRAPTAIAGTPGASVARRLVLSLHGAWAYEALGRRCSKARGRQLPDAH
jgi:hypothetical protein